MKKLILLLLISLPVAMIAQVSIDRSKVPQPAPAPAIKIGDPVIFTLANGLKVFVVQNTKLPRVSATLTIDRDAVFEGNKAGLVSMAGQLMKRGTTTMSKVELDEAIDYLGANIFASARNVSGSSLTNNFSKVMGLMADIALRPAFNNAELDKIKKEQLSNLVAAKESAEAIANNVANKLMYGSNHPYGEIETEASIKNVTVDDVKKYYNTYWKPNIAYLIFVGDISVAQAKILAEANFSKWKSGVVPAVNYPKVVAPAKTFIAIVDRPSSVQSVISIVSPVDLRPGSPNAIAASITNNILGGGANGKLFLNLREKYGFTYGAYSSLSSDKLVGNFNANASVRNEKTDSSIGQFLYEFNKMKTEIVASKDLTLAKNEMSGAFGRSLENPSTIAGFALSIATEKLPADYYRNYLKNVAAVNETKVKEIANKYITDKNMIVVVVGNAKEISKGLEKYGEVKYFDADGNPTKAPETKTVAAGITAESIIAKAANATASKEDMAKLADLEMIGTASIMGTELSYNQKYILPGSFAQNITMQGMSMMSQVAKGGTYKVVQQGQEVPLKDKDKEELKETAAYFTEAYYLANSGYSFKLNGIEKVEGNDAFVVEIKSSTRSFTAYYDCTTYLRVKDTKVEEGPQGSASVSVYYKEYKAYNGVQVPVKLLADQGQLKIEINIKEVKVNQGLKAEDIK